MGFLDKAKSAAAEAAQKAKEGAEFAAQKAKETGETVQTKRELSSAYDELGHKAFDLVSNGAISHGDLTELVDRIKELQTKLEAIGDEVEDAVPADDHTATPA